MFTIWTVCRCMFQISQNWTLPPSPRSRSVESSLARTLPSSTQGFTLTAPNPWRVGTSTSRQQEFPTDGGSSLTLCSVRWWSTESRPASEIGSSLTEVCWNFQRWLRAPDNCLRQTLLGLLKVKKWWLSEPTWLLSSIDNAIWQWAAVVERSPHNSYLSIRAKKNFTLAEHLKVIKHLVSLE